MAGKACQLIGRTLRSCVSTVHNGARLRSRGPFVSNQSQFCLSTQTFDNILIEREEATGVAVVKMNRKPVNSLSLEMLTDMHLAFEKLEGDKSCRGVILTSANPGVFSAGLDIMEMYQPEEARLREFWRNVQEIWLRLYGSSLITIAAINGHSPAGGCLLALCCDYRVMAAPKFTIGLNETLLGIIPPFWFTDTFLNTCGQRRAEYSLQLGEMFSSEKALQANLVDELADIGLVFQKAREQMDVWLKIPDLARQLTKSGIRSGLIQKLKSRREEDINTFVNFIMKDSVQKTLEVYLESLKKRKS
ncbi:enoyl-CoA delta isomerase 1, mitochondrial-like isoform X2 [Liolophura sinensis]|uniref:enoyl-CoA delta isomerase 1, mitochondrial-like isoform X2 n=1 Tax=Liolophura sinensis TaxID=3198878 RepID=UPI0031594B0C